jgi:ERCC4-type nuclease
MLEALGAKVERTQLEVGDYMLGTDVIVDRKEAGDFLASIMDAEVPGQKTRLKM